MSHWHKKDVLITGGSAGLGFAIAEAFARAGANVAIVGRDIAKLEQALLTLKRISPHADFLGIPADVTIPADVDKIFARVKTDMGKIDVLVNTVGVSMRGELLRTTPEEFTSLFETNVLSMVRCIQAAAPHLVASRGSIVNIGSLAAKSAAKYLGAYPASKFAVAAISQQLRLELESQGVHTLLVCPGPLARNDAGERYRDQASHLPAEANKPGGGVKLKGIDPQYLAARIVRACERRDPELVVPWKARLLFAISQLWPRWGDWLVRKNTGG